MKCGAKIYYSKKQNEYVNYAPKRGGVGYWLYIAVFAYSIPMIVVLAIAWGFLYFIPSKISVIISLAIAFCSPLVAFFIARKGHHRLMKMPDDQYESCFNQHYHRTVYKENVDPYDPESSIYWIYGPRGTRNHD